MLPVSNIFRPFDRIMHDMNSLMPAMPMPTDFFADLDRPEFWHTTIQLSGFRPEEVSTRREEKNGKNFLVIHARHESGADYSEFHRTVTLPDNIDLEKLHLHFSKRGVLIIKAPYLRTDNMLALFNDFDRPTFTQQLGKTSIVPDEATGGEKWRADFGVEGFKPEEISLTQQGSRVLVEAHQEHKTDDSSSFRRMRKEVTLPQGVEAEKMVSQMSQDGKLRIEAPYVRPPQQAAIEGRKIPIESASAATPSVEMKEA